MSSDVANVEVEIGGRKISEQDIEALLDAGRLSIDPGDRMVLHAVPAFYTLDGLNGVKKPLGLHANRLAVDIHVVAATPAPVENLRHCVQSAYLGVEAIVAAPVAAGKACLSEEERELGVALVELGAGVTNVSVYVAGQLAGMKSIPQGAGDITDDIASTFATRRAEAERIKCFYGSASTSPRDNHDMIELAPIAGGQDGVESARITRAELVAVIRRRLENLTARSPLRWSSSVSPSRSGGSRAHRRRRGAERDRRLRQGALGRTVRHRAADFARPAGRALAAPASATLAGLAQYARATSLTCGSGCRCGPGAGARPASGGVLGRLISAFRADINNRGIGDDVFCSHARIASCKEVKAKFTS
jgi:cell division protein FtsA